MSDINRIGSPMDLLDENIDEAPEKVRSRKKFLLKKQRTKSPFLIGCMEEVSRRISQLDQRLQDYKELVCESRASNADDAFVIPNSARRRDLYQQREKEKKELCEFAGMYTLKSTLLPNLNTQAKNISKTAIKPKQHQVSVLSKENSGKPKLVELHLYPGYDPREPTHLPGGFQPGDIFSKVVDASVYLIRKPNNRAKFEQLFCSPMSQTILLPNSISQQKLFDRTAHNYVHLLMSSTDPAVKDTFLKEYPRLMSQAVYSSFCFAFPDSHRQFGEKFKDDLTYVVYGWMAGIRPSPRSWMTWDISSLEPLNLQLREGMMNRKNNKKGKSFIDFDYLDSLISAKSSQLASSRSRSLSQSTSKSSVPSAVVTSNCSTQAGIVKVTQKPKTSSFSKKSGNNLTPQDSGAVKAVTDVQEVRRSMKNGGGTIQTSKTLTPIQEMMSENGDTELSQKLFQVSHDQSRHVSRKSGKESHPVGRGCDFVHSVFNMEGKSPLVQHFLRVRGLDRNAGQLVWVHRVELENLPSIDAPTYRDIITESSKNIGQMKKTFLEHQRENLRASQVLINEQKAVLKEHMRKQASLLTSEKEVKRLSDLIIMEQRRSKDSVAAGADAAVAAALMAQD